MASQKHHFFAMLEAGGKVILSNENKPSIYFSHYMREPEGMKKKHLKKQKKD